MKESMLLGIVLMASLGLVHGKVKTKYISEIDVVRYNTFAYIEELWSNVTSNVEWIYKMQKDQGTDTALLQAYKKLCDMLDKFPINRVPEVVVDSMWSYLQLTAEVVGIDGLYGNFRKYQGEPPNKHSMFKRAWQDLAETVLQNSDTIPSIPSALDHIHSLIIHNDDYGDDSLFDTVKESPMSLCHVQQSPHQILYNLYNSLQMSQLKGYTMIQFSWMLLRLYKKGNFTVEYRMMQEKYLERMEEQAKSLKDTDTELLCNFTVESRMMQEKYLERMEEQAKALKDTLELADKSYWKCDPKLHVEGETYVQLTRLLQGYIQNEVDLNPKASCSENCAYYQVSKQHGCYENNFCARQRSCQGDIVECQYIDSDMWVCQADPNLSPRRYEWIEYENGRVLGNKGSCHRTSKVDSWWRWLFWHCSYCFCVCDDATNSDRYFSLHDVNADTIVNKVVTGLRFVKRNGIIHMQIQEGVLEGYGHINQSSITWRPVDDIKPKNSDFVEGRDYVQLSYYKRAIDLDDLTAPPEHVITGVKFRMVGSHINLEIRATPFNFTSGSLIQPEKRDLWISNDNTDGAPISPRTKLTLDSPDKPLHSLTPSIIDSKSDQYLLFTHSDIDLDAAQSTVPYLDSQIVAPQPPVPLSGIGIYHKGQRWFGGFIGLKVFTYDFGAHIQDTFTELSGTSSVNEK